MATLDLRVCSTKEYSAHCRPSKFTGILELPLSFADGLRVLKNLASTPGISFSLTPHAMCPLMAHMRVLAKPTCTCSSWSLASCFPNCACAAASPEMWGQGRSLPSVSLFRDTNRPQYPYPQALPEVLEAEVHHLSQSPFFLRNLDQVLWAGSS